MDFISEIDDSWFWEYQDLQILFTSKSFSCKGTIPGSSRFLDLTTNKEVTVEVNKFILTENGGTLHEEYVVHNENKTLNDIFPYLIDQLIFLAKASVETGNPVIWY